MNRLECFFGAGIAFILALGVGCTADVHLKPKLVDSVDEIGTPRINVVSVIPWNTIRDELAPNFQLTAEQAKAGAIPTTRYSSYRALHAFGAEGKVSLPTTSTTSTINSLPDGTLNPENPGGTTTSSGPGDLSTVPTASTGVDGQKASSLMTINELGKKEPDLDSVLEYWAATALFQEVKLIDSYLKHPSFESRKAAYLVRAQVVLMPRARNMPYDTYVNLGFFRDTNTETDSQGRAYDGEEVATPTVIPILATDILESQVRSAAAENLRSLALSLAGMASGVAFSGSFKDTMDEIDEHIGRDLNGVLTIGRLGDNVLRVRIGAYQQSEARYALVPKTQNISFVVLVPESWTLGQTASRLRISSVVEYVNAVTGETVATKSTRAETKDLKTLTSFYGVGRNNLDRLWELIVDSDWQGFLAHVNQMCAMEMVDARNCDNGKYVYTAQLWTELAALQTTYVVDVVNLWLPPGPRQKFVPRQAAMLVDDGKNATTVTLRGASNLNGDELYATLELGSSADRQVFVANKVEVVESGRAITAVFPSLHAFALAETARKGGGVVRICSGPGCTGRDPSLEFVSSGIFYNAPAATAASPGFTLKAASGTVVATGQTGNVLLLLDPEGTTPARSVSLSVTGVDVTGCALNDVLVPLLGNGCVVTVAAKARVTLAFNNLTPETKIKIEGKSDRGLSLALAELPVRVATANTAAASSGGGKEGAAGGGAVPILPDGGASVVPGSESAASPDAMTGS